MFHLYCCEKQHGHLGVEADSELKQEASRVLFSVTHRDKHEALDKIREALSVYVLLPGSSMDDNSFDIGNSIEYQRLVANVLHLKSQLQLARALYSAQETNLKAQQVALNHQRMLSGTVMEESIIDVQPARSDARPVSDKENLFGGRLTLSPGAIPTRNPLLRSRIYKPHVFNSRRGFY